ncbi:MAG: toxin-antitoxin system YwqK family antitoxin, partial [Flavobacteriales bacterium]
YAYQRKKQQKDDQKYYLSQLQHFNKGVAVDTHAYYYPNGTFDRYVVYNQKGELNGNNVQFNREGSITWFSNYENDKLEGILYEINSLGDTVTKGYFIHGKEEGKYHQEHYDYEQEIYDFRLVSTYHNGKLDGDLTLKDSYNTVRLALKIDSGYSNGGNYNYINEQSILNDWRSDLAFTGEVNVYHPNGKKYLNGRMQMYTDTLPSGALSYGMNKVNTWTYYNNVERKVAELNFVNDAKLIFDADTLIGSAYYSAFYPNGAIKYIGVLNYEDTRLNCATDIQESDFVATYSTFLSVEGDTLVKNGTGSLKLFNIDGNVFSEGDLKNGKKNGWWKTYNDEGKLIEVGQYIDDQKDGRWLSGDLSGINYLDPQCFENEEKKQEKQELEKYKIEIEEIIYSKGEELISQSYEFTRTR